MTTNSAQQQRAWDLMRAIEMHIKCPSHTDTNPDCCLGEADMDFGVKILGALTAEHQRGIEEAKRYMLEFITEAVEQLGAEPAANLAIGYLQSELGMTRPISEVRARIAAKRVVNGK